LIYLLNLNSITTSLIYLAQTYNRSTYQREGLYKTEFILQFFWKGKNLDMKTLDLKGGLTYKLSGEQFLSFNAAYLTKAPTMKCVSNARLNKKLFSKFRGEKLQVWMQVTSSVCQSLNQD
jgi:hypothetical protein